MSEITKKWNCKKCDKNRKVANKTKARFGKISKKKYSKNCKRRENDQNVKNYSFSNENITKITPFRKHRS